MKELPITPDDQLKNPKWSYLYAYNLRTLRDIFVYCAKKKKIKEKILYEDLACNKISPPKNLWISKGIKRKERLRLEYIHASEYLGLIKRKDGFVTPNFQEFEKEKKTIIDENTNRNFESAKQSPAFTGKEKSAFINLLFAYGRAKDFLRWFLDFSKYKGIQEFSINDFKKNGQPIFVLGKTVSSQKGSEVLRKFGNNKKWRIPLQYIRLANFVFPSWFSEVGLIGKLIEFPEFSKDKNLWHVFYPIKIATEEFLKIDGRRMLEKLFLKKKDKRALWIPYVIYEVVLKYGCPVNAVKILLKQLYEEDYEHFYLERTSLQVMKGHKKYEESYIKVDGFYRSTLILKRRENKNG